MNEYEQILLSFANALTKQETFKYDRHEIIKACIAGADAIRELRKAQETVKSVADVLISNRSYIRGSKHE